MVSRGCRSQLGRVVLLAALGASVVNLFSSRCFLSPGATRPARKSLLPGVSLASLAAAPAFAEEIAASKAGPPAVADNELAALWRDWSANPNAAFISTNNLKRSSLDFDPDAFRLGGFTGSEELEQAMLTIAVIAGIAYVVTAVKGPDKLTDEEIRAAIAAGKPKWRRELDAAEDEKYAAMAERETRRMAGRLPTAGGRIPGRRAGTSGPGGKRP
eukprot:TRINITY_DN92678_c0_g1_i1.p1 TRINITY_DN92678_c0_g1~~TRINITY_DN92678_c0_g1_i1.p1  ORF type:complete len:215 (+),score=44.96 TRINITY_DN92678_c0_g1_i1:109-753(+)